MAIPSERQKTAGSRARSLRRRRAVTLDTLAERLKLSKGHLSRFERGDKALSVRSLLRLAEELDTSLGSLFGEVVEDDDIHLMRAKDVWFEQTGGSEADYRYALLSGRGDHSTFIVELERGKHHASWSFHAGIELFYLRSGSVRMTLADKVLDLDEGDYLEFSGSTPHLIESLTSKAVFLMIVI